MRPIHWIVLCITFQHRKRAGGQGVVHGTPHFTKVTLADSNFTITSDGYPDFYDINTESMWELDTTGQYNKNQTIRLNFVDVDIANTTECSSDYIKIYEDISQYRRDNPLAEMCNQGERIFEFYIKFLLIVFKTGDEHSGTGFKLFIQIRNASSCDKQLIAESETQYLTSENYPSPYSGFQRCTYLIEPRTEHMNVKFIVTMSELDLYCWEEYVLVYDGNSEDSPLLGKWCGNGRPTYKSMRGSLYIVFVSKDNSHATRSGFKALYKEEMCGETINTKTTQSTFISFPPSIYQTFGGRIRCKWTINAGSSKEKIFVHVTNTSIDCLTSVITLDDGLSVTPFCRSQDALHVSGLSKMIIKLRTDLNDHYPPTPTAFKLHFWSERAEGCGTRPALLKATFAQNVLESPGYPFRYPDQANCVWEFVSLTHNVKITVDNTDLNLYKCEDYIAFYNVPAHRLYNIKPAMKVCGTETKTFYSEGHHVTVNFITNYHNGGKGFILYYQSYKPEDRVKSFDSSTLLTGILGVLAVVVVIAICVGVYVGRKRCRSSALESPNSNNAPGESTMRFLDANPINDINDTTPVTSSAPPPSYQELSNTPVQIQHLAAEPSAPCLPPPSYEDAVSKGMLIESVL